MDFGRDQQRAFRMRKLFRMPQLIGIAGGSCAGKSWLAERLERSLSGLAVRLSLDDFYRDRSNLTLEERSQINFDHPDAIDWKSFEAVLCSCRKGQKTLIPQYDFAAHVRRPTERVFKPAPLILLEGLWLFRRLSLRRMFALKIFLRGPFELCKERRLRRDCLERGRSESETAERFDQMVAPMQAKFVTPQERWADLVLDGPATDESVEKIAIRLRELVNPPSI